MIFPANDTSIYGISYGFTRTAGMTRDRMRYFLALHALHVLHVLHWRPGPSGRRCDFPDMDGLSGMD